jgi:hypothetical protein
MKNLYNKKRNKNKKGFMDLSFGWIFGLIVGGVVLFLAIYMATQYAGFEKKSQTAQSGRQIEAWFNSLNTGENVSLSTTLTSSVETRIYSECQSYGEFGKQILRVDEKSMNEFQTGMEIDFKNQYIYISESSSEIPEKSFSVFSNTFNFPFKISNLIYIIPLSKEYCFVVDDENRREKIENLNRNNLKVADSVNECNEDSETVCFTSGNCDINVKGSYVEKGEEKMYYSGDALMYAAIFSDKELYECQLKRLMKRTSKLANMYIYKSKDMVGCDMSTIKMGLNTLKDGAKGMADAEGEVSQRLSRLSNLQKNLNKKNDQWKCRLW